MQKHSQAFGNSVWCGKCISQEPWGDFFTAKRLNKDNDTSEVNKHPMMQLLVTATQISRRHSGGSHSTGAPIHVEERKKRKKRAEVRGGSSLRTWARRHDPGDGRPPQTTHLLRRTWWSEAVEDKVCYWHHHMRASQSCCCEDLKPQGHVINIPLGHLKKRCWVLFFFCVFFGWVGVVTCTFALFGQSEYMKPRGRCLTGRQYSTGRTIQRKGGGGGKGSEVQVRSLLLKLDRVVVEQNMPALYLLVFVLEAIVPVLQTLSFGLDPQLTSSWRQREMWKHICQFNAVNREKLRSCYLLIGNFSAI